MSDVSWNTRVLGERGTQVSGQPVDDLGAPPFLGTPLADQGADPPVKDNQFGVHQAGGLHAAAFTSSSRSACPTGTSPASGRHPPPVAASSTTTRPAP